MSDFDWRTWLYDRLRQTAAVSVLVPETSIHGAGSITVPPASKPFIVITLGEEFSEFSGVSQQDATLWFHDEPGTYNRIDEIRKAVKLALCGASNTGQVLETGATVCRWRSDSRDLSDEGYGTIMKNTEYQLVGRSGNG